MHDHPEQMTFYKNGNEKLVIWRQNTIETKYPENKPKYKQKSSNNTNHRRTTIILHEIKIENFKDYPPCWDKQRPNLVPTTLFTILN